MRCERKAIDKCNDVQPPPRAQATNTSPDYSNAADLSLFAHELCVFKAYLSKDQPLVTL